MTSARDSGDGLDVAFEHDRTNVAARQTKRQRKADRASADDDYRCVHAKLDATHGCRSVPASGFRSPRCSPSTRRERTFVRGDGTSLVDSRGGRVYDAVSSIWTTIHGHWHPGDRRRDRATRPRRSTTRRRSERPIRSPKSWRATLSLTGHGLRVLRERRCERHRGVR